MTDELVLYTNPMSRGRIARWMLEEVGAPYTTEILEYGTTMKAEPYLSINPMGKVPAIRHRGTVVTEVAAICAYLADAFPDAKLAPAPTDPLRGAYYRWFFFGSGCVEPVAWLAALKIEPPVERRGMLGFGTRDDVHATLEKALAKGPYLLGDQFTAADVYLGSQLAYGVQFGTLEKRPGFEEYVARIHARPAAVKARKIDDDLVEERKRASTS